MTNQKQQNSSKRPKVPFTQKEDQIINFFVNTIGTKKWSTVAKFVKSRTAKQCRDRYMNYLKPGLSNIEWTQDEDDILLDLYSKYGPKWSTINKHFENRNQVSLKNRFIFLQRQLNQDERKNENQKNLIHLKSQYHKNNEAKITKLKYPIPEIINDSKKNNQENLQKNSKELNKEVLDSNKDESIFHMENDFDFPDEFSSYSLFNEENDFNF